MADLLWDQGSEQQLMNDMRVLLSGLRRELGPYVAITRESVAFDRAAPQVDGLTRGVIHRGLDAGMVSSRSSRLQREAPIAVENLG